MKDTTGLSSEIHMRTDANNLVTTAALLMFLNNKRLFI